MFNILNIQKKLILTITVISYYNSSISQSFSIGFESGHSISFNSIDFTSKPNLSRQFYYNFENLNIKHKPLYIFSNALNVKTKLSKKWCLISTIGQSKINFIYETNSACFYNKTSSKCSAIFKHQFNYLDLSAGTQYYVPIKKAKIYFHSSVEYNYLVRYRQIGLQRDYPTQTTTARTEVNLTTKRDINKSNFSIYTGLGIEFKFKKKLHFFSHINYRNMILIFSPDTKYKDKIHSIGIKLGTRIAL